MAAGSVSAPLIIPIIHLQTHRTKNHITTSTPVSIQSDSSGVQIYFTLDGSKPVAGQRGMAGSSRKYSGPILLPAGRVSVRAMAVTSDGRQSSVVTKVFSVDQLEDVDPQNHQQHLSDGTSCSAENSDSSSPSPKELRVRHPPPGPRFLNSLLGLRTTRTDLCRPGTGVLSCERSIGSHMDVPVCQESHEVEHVSSTEATRVQRETNFLWCPHCLNACPTDPLAQFCPQCGAVVPPLPGQRLPPPEAAQTLLCVFCNSVVPVNTHTCLICEEPVGPQRRPQACLSLQDHVVCVSCGSGNPANISSCLTCEHHLKPVGCGDVRAPSGPTTNSRMSTCSRCERLNQSDAKFCDWCGAKKAQAVNRVTCWRCGANGHPYALFCAACGVRLEAPAPPTSCSDITPPVRDATSSRVTPPTVDQCTQTVGLYYPSAAELEKKEQQRVLQVKHRPPLTAISPGRGYWRKQLDHVCAHLRSYAQNNAPFRALLGEPRLGRMVSAVIQDDHEKVSLTFSFMSARQDEYQDGSDGPAGGGSGPAGVGSGPAGGGSGPADWAETLSDVTEQSISSSLRCCRALCGIKPRLKSTPAASNSQLLKELGQGGGRISTVQQLLDQGADPSCCGSDGRHALSVAVVNGHHYVLPVLVQRGADVDQRSGPMKNTALHDAAALGARGLQCAEVLLRCKASMRLKNGAGQTAYDVAVTSGCSDMASLMTAQIGLDLLGQLGRPRLNLDVF